MARRATPPSKKQTKVLTTASAKMSEPVAAGAPPRGRKAKSVISAPAEPSLTDIFFPGGEESASSGAEVGPNPPVKTRRGRKPKAQTAADASPAMAVTDGFAAENAPPDVIPTSGDEKQLEVQTDSSALLSTSPRKTRLRRGAQDEGQSEVSTEDVAASQPMQSSAVRWDFNTETATFDWLSIEQFAAADGPNQAMAKLLLAARAEGANSRWPF